MDCSAIQAATIEAAGDILRLGGVCVYPTETYFGLGAGVFFPDALARVAAIKGRPAEKPLPLVAANLEQVAGVLSGAFAASPGYADFMRLAGAFWPGPLSLVVPTREELSPLVKDARGRTSVRITPHPVAGGLCLAAGCPLAATSANRSGGRPAAWPGQLDRDLCARVDAVVLDPPLPAGGPASTVAVPEGGGRLVVLRRGAVTDEALALAGFVVTFSSP